MDVSGVPRKKHPPGPIVRCAAIVQPEVGHPYGIADPHPCRRVPVDQGLNLGERDGWLDCWLVRTRPHRQDPPRRRNPQWEEEQDAVRGYERVRPIGLDAFGLEVREYKGLRIGTSLERDARLIANGAMRAVASDDVAGVEGFLPAIAVAQPARHATAGLNDFGELHAALEIHSAAGDVLADDPLRLRLRHEQQIRIGRVVDADVEQAHRNHPASEMHLQTDRLVTPVHQLVGHTEAGEDLQRARLHTQGPRFVNPVELTIDEPEPGSVLRQLRGQRETRRTSAHDQHIDVGFDRLRTLAGHASKLPDVHPQ